MRSRLCRQASAIGRQEVPSAAMYMAGRMAGTVPRVRFARWYALQLRMTKSQSIELTTGLPAYVIHRFAQLGASE